MIIHRVEPLKCPVCESTRVANREYKIKCYDCRKDYSKKDGKGEEFKTSPYYGASSGPNHARFLMGDYYDNKGPLL